MKETISMSIYNNTSSTQKQVTFTPTWLYIKQHNKTGLKYFGKHVGCDPHKYKGSGTYWRHHLRVHGNDVTTIWSHLFNSKSELVNYAITFSHKNNITESNDWANLKPENGLDGNPHGLILSESHKAKISAGSKGKLKGRIAPNRGIKHTARTRTKIGNAHRGVQKSEISKQRMSKAKKGKPKTKVCRLIDRKVMDISNFNGWVNKINAFQANADS